MMMSRLLSLCVMIHGERRERTSMIAMLIMVVSELVAPRGKSLVGGPV